MGINFNLLILFYSLMLYVWYMLYDTYDNFCNDIKKIVEYIRGMGYNAETTQRYLKDITFSLDNLDDKAIAVFDKYGIDNNVNYTFEQLCKLLVDAKLTMEDCFKIFGKQTGNVAYSVIYSFGNSN